MTVKEFLKQSQLQTIDSKIILQHVTHLSMTDIIAHSDKELSEDQIEQLKDFSEKRKSGIPVEYIVGKKDFYKDTFEITEGILIPQPDTEILVEDAIKTALNSTKKTYRILDLCSGSGCIGVSVAKEVSNHFENFEVVFADISPIAIECTTRNAERLLKDINYRIVQSDLFCNIEKEPFDLILTNPPYIATNVIPTLESDVQHEPLLALDGGPDGLDIIKKIIRQAPACLCKNGSLLMEIGYDQGSEVSTLFKEAGFSNICILKDLGARERVVKGSF